MKIGGKEVLPPKPEVVVIPRGNGEQLVIECKVITDDYKIFDQLCPMPLPPKILRKGDTVASDDFTSKEFLDAMKKWYQLRGFFQYIYSLKDSIEFEKVKLNDPSTWELLDDEFREVGITGLAYSRILTAVQEVNGLNPDLLDQAKERFLADRRAEKQK